MKGHSRKAQFIVVSLRKVTLKEADHIYGVTQAGNGLSQMIANFDINLVNEKGELTNGGKGGSTQLVAATKAAGGSDGDPKAGKSIGETVKDMLKVEVDK